MKMTVNDPQRLPIVGEKRLRDPSQRTIRYLRVSLTDRCNYRCTYCMPPEGLPAVPQREVLTFEEVGRIVGVMAAMGVERIRLTGGEPLVRRGVVDLVRRIAETPGIRQVAMTTNGQLLARHASALWAAGLRSLNVSLDTFDPEAFRRITRGGDLFEVLRGIHAAEEAGFEGIKINIVSMRGLNHDAHLDIVERCWRHGWTPRFIELMPIGQLEGQRADLVPNDAVLANVAARHPVQVEGYGGGTLPQGPAHYAVVTGGPFTGHRVGFISPMSDDGFCARCNRARLTAKGGLRACLADDREVSILQAIRGGADDETLVDVIRAAVRGKKPQHALRGHDGAPASAMTGIGG